MKARLMPIDLVVRLGIVFLLASSLGSCGEDATDLRLPEAPKIGQDQPPLISASRPAPDAQLQVSLGSYLGISAGRIAIVDSVEVGGESFAIARISGRKGSLVAASFIKEGDKYRPETVAGEPGQPAFSERPKTATGTSYLIISGNRYQAMVGLFGSRLTRAQTLTPEGRTLDTDKPNEIGAITLLTDEWGQVRVFEGERLDSAALLFSASFPEETEVSEAGGEVATEFTSLLLSSEWQDAAESLSSRVPAAKVLPLLRSTLSRSGKHVEQGKIEGPSVVVKTTGSPTAGELRLFMVDEDGRWKVWAYAFRTLG